MNTSPHATQPQWRSLEDRARLLAGGQSTEGEFASGHSEWSEAFSRRAFLQSLSATLSLAGLAGCTRQPREEIVPYVRQPEELVPGEPLWFATAMELGGRVNGLLVKSHDGRPTKIEGNPDHPETQGRSSVQMQAALLNLYDPDRSKTVLHQGQPGTWNAFLGALIPHRAAWQGNSGKGLRLLTSTIASPALMEQIEALLKKHPAARWHRHDAAFPRQPAETICHFDRAEVVLSLGADFLGNPNASLRDIREFTRKRGDAGGMNRLYVVEAMPSLTGAMADHRLALPPAAMGAFAMALIQEAPAEPWMAAVHRDLQQHRGRSLVIAGEFEPAAVHAAARALNESLGNVGITVEYRTPAGPQPGSLEELVTDMQRGEVTTLLLLDVNPVFTAPADLPFAEALTKVPLTVHLDFHADETAARCQWHLPQSHFLESWSDLRASDGTLSVVQPLIAPLYATVSAHELLAAVAEATPREAYDIVRDSWRARLPTGDFEAQWRKVLHDGVRLAGVNPSAPASEALTSPARPATSLELLIRPDPQILDGRFARNAWLQELPRPLTKLTWENAAHLSEATAQRLGIAHGDVVELHLRGRALTAPAWVMPGHADDCVTIHLGHGRNGLGFNANALQFSDALWGGPGLEVRKTGKTHVFSTTQEHQSMEGRDLVRVETIGAPEVKHEPPPGESLFPPVKYAGQAWGMTIDLNACIGCSACTIACQAENNIPAVGREQVLLGRQMQWIRIDRYFSGAVQAPQILHQPVTCMHCENAPCEVVCPVAATVHDHEGLNLMVYNRCVGTRYCSNNCPYKVRRFNFLKYTDDGPQLKLQRNPDVTVRMRGVMEKCTYCVQRISKAHITADKQNRRIEDGEVVTACMQACPAEAIVFGDLNDPASRVARMKASKRNYALLGELNTRPRTTYLSKLRNPNPELG